MPEEATTEAPESTEPAVEAPAVDAPAVEAPEATSDAPEATAPADPFAEYGGAETVKSAYELYEATRTQEGIVELFIEAGRSLGLGTKELEALFGASDAPEPEEEDDPDRPVTAKEFKDMLAKQQEAAATAQREAAEAVASKTVSDTLESLGVKLTKENGEPDPIAEVVLNLGDKYLKDGDLSPEAVAAAVRRGHADMLALVEQQAKEYVKTKAEQAASVPSAPKGAAAPATPEPEEPKNVLEAIKMARQRLGIA